MLTFYYLDVDQLNQILGILGTPDEETLCRVGSERVGYFLYTYILTLKTNLNLWFQAQVYIRSLPRMPKIPFENLYPRGTISRPLNQKQTINFHYI